MQNMAQEGSCEGSKVLRTWVEPQLGGPRSNLFPDGGSDGLVENRFARTKSRESSRVCEAKIMSKPAAPGTFSVGPLKMRSWELLMD